MGYIEEKKTISLLSSFRKNPIDTCTVIREGQRLTVHATELAAGDLVEIKVGDRIPADLRLIRTNALKIDSSEFTGESYPASKNSEYSNENPLEARNLCFYNTLVTEGMGLGVVIATGERTVISRLRNLAKSLTKREISTPLELSLFVQNCAIQSSIFGLFVLSIALLMDYSWTDSFVLFIGILFAVIPNSLLMVVNVAFNLTVRRMARKYCLVKNFKSIETLGNSHVLICDKTGTLTQNRLTVNHYWVNNEIYPADNTEDQELSQQLLHLHSFLALSLASILCNSAEFENGQSEVPILKRKTTNSDSIESALLKCMELAFGNVVEKRKLHTRVLEMPFNPLLKIHATIHSMNYELLIADNPKYANCYNVRRSKYLIVIKGMPEKVLERCTSAFVNGREMPITDEFRLEFNKAYLHFGSLGERVVGFADLCLPKDKYSSNFKFDADSLNFPLVGLRFLGLVSLIDPPRSSVADSISKIRSAGVKVVVATGDHPTTAKAIARMTNIISEHNETIEEAARRCCKPIQQLDPQLAQVTIVHGTDMQQYTPEMLDSLTSSNQELIFARLTPQQKLQIVESFQRIGSIVASIGDGLNDIPMLKKSDVSVCLGASDALKDQADLFILDNNFSTIVTCIVEGRWCKVNLKKIIAYLLSSNCPQLVAFISCFLFSLPLPFAVVGVLCIDLITNIVPAISLAYEDPEFGLQAKEDKNQNAESNVENKKGSSNLMKYNVFSAKTIDDGYQELLSAGPNDSSPIINAKLICYSYLQIGVIQSIAGLFAYFVIMAENGFWLSSLFYLRQEWDSMAVNDLKDSVGQEWVCAF